MILFFVLFMSWLNWRGLKLVGAVTIVFVLAVLLPFAVLVVIAVTQHFHVATWFRDRPFVSHSMADIQWFPLLNTVVWCLNYFDSASTLAGEVDEPNKNIPSALFWCVGVAISGYVLPILACAAALPGQTWATGFWVQAGLEIGGPLLQWWIFSAAMVSFSGQFLSSQATVTYELLGMAELGQLPTCFMTRNSEGVPMWSLLLSVVMVLGTLTASNNNLVVAISLANAIYSIAEIINYAAFIWLRWKHPTLNRPYRTPLGILGCLVMLTCPFLLSLCMVVSPYWTGQWGVGVAIIVCIVTSALLHNLLQYSRGCFPDSFLEERQSQSQDEGLQVSLKASED
jgi:amino acid transporter